MNKRFTFECIADMVEAAMTPANQPRALLNIQEGEPADWYGLPSDEPFPLARLAELVNRGWDEGRKALLEAINAVTPPSPVNIKRRPVWADQGDEIDMQRVWSGQLDQAWRRTTKNNVGASRRNITVTVDAIAQGDAKAETMFWRGAAAVVLADVLTSAGYAVQMVTAFRGSVPGGNEVSVRVVVKPYAQMFDLASAAAGMALPGFFRGIGHAWGYGHLDMGKDITQSGWCVEAVDYPDVSDLARGGILFIADQAIQKREQAEAWVNQCVSDLESGSGAMGNE